MNEVENGDQWSKLRTSLTQKTRLVHCKTRQIWWCSLGMSIGKEIYGKNELFERPVLILKIYSREMALIVPLTSKKHRGDYITPIQVRGSTSYALMSQARSISIKRLTRMIERIPTEEFDPVLENYIQSLK